MRSLLFALSIAAFFVSGAAIAQERPVQLEALPQASRDALSSWLRRDCSKSTTQEELAPLRALSGAVQGALLEAYKQGPPPELERAYEDASSEAFDARNATLAREGERLFGAEDVARLRGADRETYINRRLEAARLNYRTNAVLGLGVVGARDALPLLDQIAAEADNPMREAARNSIVTLRGQSAPQQSR